MARNQIEAPNNTSKQERRICMVLPKAVKAEFQNLMNLAMDDVGTMGSPMIGL